MDELTTAFLSTALQLSTPIGLAVLAFIVGKWVEVEHLEDLDRRETATKPTLALSLKRPPEALSATEGRMVTGSVVISLDYFKRIMAMFRALVGGNVRSYEPLLVRARREAVLRMKEQAIAGGYRAVINVRIETSRIASNRSDGKGTAGIEILAFGTAVR